jgi:hypothetical protein
MQRKLLSPLKIQPAISETVTTKESESILNMNTIDIKVLKKHKVLPTLTHTPQQPSQTSSRLVHTIKNSHETSIKSRNDISNPSSPLKINKVAESFKIVRSLSSPTLS